MVEVTGEVEPDMGNHRVYEDMYRAYTQAYEGLRGSGAFTTLGAIQAR
jgi:hypothetical protein